MRPRNIAPHCKSPHLCGATQLVLCHRKKKKYQRHVAQILEYFNGTSSVLHKKKMQQNRLEKLGKKQKLETKKKNFERLARNMGFK